MICLSFVILNLNILWVEAEREKNLVISFFLLIIV
jgi:hypothetical protein